jgi:hypothetical protein
MDIINYNIVSHSRCEKCGNANSASELKSSNGSDCAGIICIDKNKCEKRIQQQSIEQGTLV